MAAVLAVLGLPPGAATDRRTEPPRLRAAWRPTVLRAGVVALVGWASLGGLAFLVALRAGDAFGLSAGARGLLLTGFGVAGLLTARLVGRGVDRVGSRRCVLAGAFAGAVLVGSVGVLPSAVAVATAWMLAGVCGQLLLVGLNALVLSGDGPNRGGSVWVVQALRFLGAAVAPAAFLPPYHLSPALGFLLPRCAARAGRPVLMPRDRPSPRSQP